MVIPQYGICHVQGEPQTLIVVLQSDLTEHHGTLVAAPLVRADRTKRIPRLNPLIEFKGHTYLLIVDKMGAVPVTDISRPHGSAHDSRDDIALALDYLFKGF